VRGRAAHALVPLHRAILLSYGATTTLP